MSSDAPRRPPEFVPLSPIHCSEFSKVACHPISRKATEERVPILLADPWGKSCQPRKTLATKAPPEICGWVDMADMGGGLIKNVLTNVCVCACASLYQCLGPFLSWYKYLMCEPSHVNMSIYVYTIFWGGRRLF